jgi:uncharacterized LabA/DUF88 family protein
MLVDSNSPMKRIAVFYDGSFFCSVSQYYKHHHEKGGHLSFQGIHDYIRQKVGEKEQQDVSFCQIAEAHFFRGRFSLAAAQQADALESDRFFDQLLMRAGIVSHYYPMDERKSPPVEKGIDVWLSLEAYDLAVHKRFDVMALFAGDADFVPLVRKVNSLGTRVMLLAWDFKYQDAKGTQRETRTAQALINEATYPIIVSDEIISRASKSDKIIQSLFVSER